MLLDKFKYKNIIVIIKLEHATMLLNLIDKRQSLLIIAYLIITVQNNTFF